MKGREDVRSSGRKPEDRADDQGEVKRPLAPNHVGRKSPEQRADEQTDIVSHENTLGVARVEFVGNGR